MKIPMTELDLIQSVIKTANTVDIPNVIIEPGKIRGMNENQTVFLFQDQNVQPLSFGSIGLNRIEIFTPRLALAKAFDNLEVNVVTVGEDNMIGFDKYVSGADQNPPMWARSLTMKGKGASIEYRCASPQTIKAPKNRAGITQYSFCISPEALDMIQKGKGAMKAKDITFIGNSKGVSFKIADINSDTLQYHITDTIDSIDGSSVDFQYTYSIDTILPILKTNITGMVSLTTKGSLVVTSNGLDIYFVTIG